MALTNYTDLLASVASWTSRADLTSIIPDFVLLAEAEFNRDLRTRNQETSATITQVAGVATLPSDFLELRRIYLNTTPLVELEYLPPEQFYLKFPTMNNWIGSPSRYYTIESGNILLSETNTQNDIKVLYYAKIPALVTNSTNWLMTAYPDLYLATTMTAACYKTKDQTGMALWSARAGAITAQLQEADKRGKFSGSAMRVIAA